jgi:hypothetical protein
MDSSSLVSVRQRDSLVANSISAKPTSGHDVGDSCLSDVSVVITVFDSFFASTLSVPSLANASVNQDCVMELHIDQAFKGTRVFSVVKIATPRFARSGPIPQDSLRGLAGADSDDGARDAIDILSSGCKLDGLWRSPFEATGRIHNAKKKDISQTMADEFCLWQSVAVISLLPKQV